MKKLNFEKGLLSMFMSQQAQQQLGINPPPPRPQLFVSPYLFFLIRNHAIVAWDFKNHQQYEIEPEYFDRLLALSSGLPKNPEAIDAELLAAELLSLQAEKVEWEWDILAQIFHLGTSIVNANPDEAAVLSQETYHDEVPDYAVPAKIFDQHAQVIALPKAELQKLAARNYLGILENRETCREFADRPVAIADLSTLLFTVFGEFHGQIDTVHPTLRKTSPSGGGLHPTQAYVFVNNVSSLKKGIYYYSAADHTLTSISSIEPGTNMSELLCGQDFATALPFGIFMTSRFDMLWKKYPHSRAYRIALLDVGHLSQTFQLTATALGLQPWLSGAFCDEKINTLLKLNALSEQTLCFVGAGYSHS